MKASDQRALIRQAAHDTVTIVRGITRAIGRARAWTDDGYPAATGGGGVRGGDVDPLPLRKTLAVAGGQESKNVREREHGEGGTPDTWRNGDAIAARLFELERDIVMWVECGERIAAFIHWTETVERHEDDRPTARCHDCRRTVLDGWDALHERLDVLKAGRCVFHAEAPKPTKHMVGGQVVVRHWPFEPEVGCYGRFERERKARYRERQREGVASVPPGLLRSGASWSEVCP